MQGCAVITPSEVKATEDWSKQTARITESASNVLNDYKSVGARFFRKRLQENWPRTEVSNEKVQTYLDLIDSADIAPVITKANAGFGVIQTYGALLEELVSNKNQSDFQDSVRAAGVEVDSAIKTLNDIGKTDHKPLGGTLARLIGFAGSVYISTRQRDALAEVLPVADRAINDACSAAATLFTRIYIPEGGLPPLSKSTRSLEQEVFGSRTKYSVDEYLSRREIAKDAVAVERAAAAQAQTFKALAESHKALVKLINDPNERQRTWETLGELRRLIQVSNQLEKEVNNPK